MKVHKSQQALALGIIAGSIFLAGIVLGLGKFDPITFGALAISVSASSFLVLDPKSKRPATPCPKQRP